MIKIIIKKRKGFSILEIIAVIFIISLGLIGILSLIKQNVQVQNINKNNLIALQLAQEGIELTRKIRDDNWLSGDWAFLNIASVDDSKSYAIDSDGIIDNVVINDNDAKLMIDSGYYMHGGLEYGNFNRIVETANDYTASSTMIDCKVQWKERNQTLEQVVSTILYDWR